MAHNREFAVIKALGINRLTNSINGSAYGDMKESWNFNEIVNFGNMILYNTFKMCCLEPPSIIYQKDVMYKHRPCTKSEKEWELLGVLEYFLEMKTWIYWYSVTTPVTRITIYFIFLFFLNCGFSLPLFPHLNIKYYIYFFCFLSWIYTNLYMNMQFMLINWKMCFSKILLWSILFFTLFFIFLKNSLVYKCVFCFFKTFFGNVSNMHYFCMSIYPYWYKHYFCMHLFFLPRD